MGEGKKRKEVSESISEQKGGGEKRNETAHEKVEEWKGKMRE